MEKSKISAKIIADSKNEFGQRITTFVLVFPRIILAELNTHRMFSRNSASSRAIPFKKMLDKVMNDPFIPIAWQKDHSGMQGTEYFTEEDNKVELANGGYFNDLKKLKERWLSARDYAVSRAKDLSNIGLTKQICNRGLETYMWHTAILTATEFENFFKLRCPQYPSIDTVGENVGKIFRSKKDWNAAHPGCTQTDFFTLNKGQGEIHIMELAEQMWDSMNENMPKELKGGEWHIPFGDNIDVDRFADSIMATGTDLGLQEGWITAAKIKIATARCARISYMNFEGKDDYGADIKLHDILSKSGHWSPFEHCAKAMSFGEYDSSFHKGFEGDGPNFYSNGWSGNFRGFIQYRKMFSDEK